MYYPDLSKSLDPVTLSLVGLTPMLAVSTTLLSGLSIGIVYLAVLILTGVSASCAGRIFPMQLNSVYLLLISAAWVSIIDLLLQAWCYELRNQLGIYLLLLAMNTTLLFHLDAFSRQKSLRVGALVSLKTALTGVALVTATGLLRELAARGGILTDIHLVSHVEPLGSLQPVSIFTRGLHLFDSSAGAFIIFGLLLAALSLPIPGRIRFS